MVTITNPKELNEILNRILDDIEKLKMQLKALTKKSKGSGWFFDEDTESEGEQ